MKSKPIHIIIDGSDNLGKTTILRMLSKEMELPVIKMPNMQTYIENNNAEAFSKLFNETIVQFKQFSFLLDRGFTSSQVYSELFGREFDLGYLKDTEKILDPKIVIFTGRHKNQEGKTEYFSFCDDPIFSKAQKNMVDEKFCELAEKKGYVLIEVHNKTPLSIMMEVLSKI